MLAAKRTAGDKRSYFGSGHPRVMAHKGASCSHPENTMISFGEAVPVADILEMDVQLSADGEAVVIHDDTVDRTTNGTGAVSSMRYAQLRELDAGYRFTTDGGKTFPFRGKGVYLPRFEEVLQAFPQMPINVELKNDSSVLRARMIELLEKYNRVQDRSVLVVANKGQSMRALRRQSPQLITALSLPEMICFLLSAWLRVPFFAGSTGAALQIARRKFNLNLVTPSVVRTAHALGLEVHVWTVNSEEQIKSLLRLGVDGVFTDKPAMMRRIIAAHCWSRL